MARFASTALCLVSALALVATVGGNVLIKGGTVVNHDQEFVADVLIEGGLIKQVAPNIKAPWGAKVVDATGKYVMPGGIDPHTHLEMPFMGQVACDDFQSGQEAALAGGTTMHIDFALPVDNNLLAGFEAWKEKAKKSVMDYGFHMAVTTWNDEVAAQMAELAKKGINSFKFFLAYKGALMVSDEQLVMGLRQCKAIGALAQIHAENGDAVALGQAEMIAKGIVGPEGHALSRPSVLEGEATGRAIKLAHFVNTPLYVVHVMSIDAMEEVAAARKAGVRVIGETVTSALTMDESKLWDPDFKIAAQYVMSPPIRSKAHQEPLQNALANGVISLVATDHAVFNSTQKAAGKPPHGDFRVLPNGVNGIEERLHMVWETMVNSGKMTRPQFVAATSTVAAQVFNLFPRKGLVAAGSDADVIVLDPAATHTISAATHHSAMDTNIYEGIQVKGKVVVTISQGKVVWENDKLSTERGAGRFVPMEPFGPLFDGIDKRDSARAVSPYGETPMPRDYTSKKDEL
eukprot:CAMPEP_0118924212 /NCGR_PEP_ID=MMETSP1169-20130426/2450_1 /TAXON_ID=36882 /ORGANISM="Pyramimonas obovata, Strain CCMP722" /LENGTH=516 /DNA_ID=CAMNT_0006865303 /DNA_START=62 /DNA_END=1612 /DNA_ORIENTATION=+